LKIYFREVSGIGNTYNPGA